MWRFCTRAISKTFFCGWKWWHFCDELMSRFWLIFWYQHHHLQRHGLTIGYRIGGKMSSQKWPLHQLECPSSLLLPLLWVLSSLVTPYATAAPCEPHTYFSQYDEIYLSETDFDAWLIITSKNPKTWKQELFASVTTWKTTCTVLPNML